ncbi:putative RNA methyltransferase [Radiomyces spectabilis]|uniref:putative RNA methyltransferase n=1 Tax=Radiomyces spectabilis TaxID=64574 RepID=UPI00222040ED|nr:putative RNA methyltransferase [Radiomyces spectabilis]KAI8377975.1 putative RNA methyltransferase [Radiomyces spectabilis]
MSDKQMKRKKPPKTYDNKFLSGPEYDSSRPGKVQKTGFQPSAALKVPVAGEPRSYTVSVAIPASIVDGAPTLEMKTILAGQIARILVIFNVDEIVVYEDKIKPANAKIKADLFLARLFQHMETPQYLRRQLVPLSSDLKFAGLLPPLDVPHHPQLHEMTRYREGVTLEKASTAEQGGTLVDVGMYRRVLVDNTLKPNVRVTVELKDPIAASETRKGQKPLQGKLVSPKLPREKAGFYWGYNIRLAMSFSRVITESPYKDGYDFTVGVTDKDGDDMYKGAVNKVKDFNHMLIVFGGPAGGLQEAVEADEDLKCAGEDAAELFDLFLNPNLGCGTRSVRLEESMTMVMSVLKPAIMKHGKKL